MCYSLQLYPYHLQDQFVQGLKVTPFDYYHSMLQIIMVDQRSYDSLPNFTARDCEPASRRISLVDCNFNPLIIGLRLTGIGRNQYIDIMNKYRSKVTNHVHRLVASTYCHHVIYCHH